MTYLKLIFDNVTDQSNTCHPAYHPAPPLTLPPDLPRTRRLRAVRSSTHCFRTCDLPRSRKDGWKSIVGVERVRESVVASMLCFTANFRPDQLVALVFGIAAHHQRSTTFGRPRFSVRHPCLLHQRASGAKGRCATWAIWTCGS